MVKLTIYSFGYFRDGVHVLFLLLWIWSWGRRWWLICCRKRILYLGRSGSFRLCKWVCCCILKSALLRNQTSFWVQAILLFLNSLPSLSFHFSSPVSQSALFFSWPSFQQSNFLYYKYSLIKSQTKNTIPSISLWTFTSYLILSLLFGWISVKYLTEKLLI